MLDKMIVSISHITLAGITKLCAEFSQTVQKVNAIYKQEAHRPQLAHLSETATADMQMACNIFPILSNIETLFWRRRFLKVFIIYGHGGYLGQWIATILAIFHSPAIRRLQMKFEQHWP